MPTFRRAARIVQDEGVAGLARRVGRRLSPSGLSQSLSMAGERATYDQQLAEFRRRTADCGCSGIEHFYWYHTVDLGDGLVTPGDYDFRPSIANFGFPVSMAGMRVLDVGSATGYFAFEFERRGAEVTSVELPSLEAWDVLTHERAALTRDLMAWLKADSPEESYRRHLTGPFDFCHARLGSRVSRCYSTVYELTPAKLGRGKFDLVFAGDVLLHLFSPLKALDVLAGLCDGELVMTIESHFPGAARQPLMSFMGLASAEADRRTWWQLSRGCAQQMCRRLGFASVWRTGVYEGIARRAWFPYRREVIWASRSASGQGRDRDRPI